MKSIIVLCFFAVISIAASSAIYKPVPEELLKDDTPSPPCPAQCLWLGVYDYPHFADCQRYYRCIHGFFFDLSCPVGKSFDHVTLTCIDTQRSRCIFEGPIEIED